MPANRNLVCPVYRVDLCDSPTDSFSIYKNTQKETLTLIDGDLFDVNFSLYMHGEAVGSPNIDITEFMLIINAYQLANSPVSITSSNVVNYGNYCVATINSSFTSAVLASGLSSFENLDVDILVQYTDVITNLSFKKTIRKEKFLTVKKSLGA